MKDKELPETSAEERVFSFKGDSIDEVRSSEDESNEGENLKGQGMAEKKYDNSVIQVMFKNEIYLRKYRTKIEAFLKHLLEDGEDFTVYCPMNNTEQEFEDVCQSFHIDKQETESCSSGKVSKSIVPFYSSNFEGILHCDGLNSNASEVEEEKPQKFTCFNCLGNHHLKECPEKFDRLRVTANKKELMKGSTERYHKEEKCNTMEPGNISSELRMALGLKDNQLPRFIYHMRIIGYPPGWMDEAKFETSGLSLYDQEGKAVTEEHSLSLSERGTVYDGEKFINFPGFNSPVPRGIIDEWKHLKMPPIQPHQQLEEALKSPNIINAMNMLKRKRPSSTPIDGSKKGKNGLEDYSRLDWTPECQSTPKQQFIPKAQKHMHTEKIHSASISQSPGTPILKQGNPYKKLPEAVKFAQGITEHLPFENLPDAVGTYEKMRGIISGVQKKLNVIS